MGLEVQHSIALISQSNAFACDKVGSELDAIQSRFLLDAHELTDLASSELTHPIILMLEGKLQDLRDDLAALQSLLFPT